MGHHNLLYIFLCVTSVASLALMSYCIFENIHEHKQPLFKTGRIADEVAGIEKINSRIIQQQTLLDPEMKMRIMTIGYKLNNITSNGTQKIDTANNIGKENVLLLFGIFIFVVMSFVVIYVIRLKKSKTDKIELTDLRRATCCEPTQLDTAAITEISINVDDSMEAKNIVERFLNIKNRV